jgi:hypothetical protein
LGGFHKVCWATKIIHPLVYPVNELFYSVIQTYFAHLSEASELMGVEMDQRISWEDSTRLFGTYHGVRKHPR